MQVAPHVSQRDEASARGERGVAERPLAVRADEHIEPADESGQQPGDVRLRPARLGERDEQQDPRTPGHLAMPLYSGVMSAAHRAACRAVGVLAVALFAWWAVADGGYAPGAWYPGAVVLLVALAGSVRPRMLRGLPPAPRLALAALAGFTAWSFCSIAWADARGDAWDGANRTLLYLTVFALFAAVPWTLGEAVAGLGAFALATAGVGGWEIARAVAGDTAGVFSDGRLAAPVGYENASAALFLVAFWPALLLAAHRPAPRWRRAVMLATAGLLLQLTILAQSRGALVAGVVTLALAVALVPDRVALIAALLAVAAVTAASLPTLLTVYEAAPEEPDLEPIALALGLSAALLFAAGLLLARTERWAARVRAATSGGRRDGRRRGGRGTRHRGRRAGRLALRGGTRLGPVRPLARGHARVRAAPDRRRGGRQLRPRLRARAQAPPGAALSAQRRASCGCTAGRRGRTAAGTLPGRRRTRGAQRAR